MDRLNVATHVLPCINFKSITFLNTKHGLKMVTADGCLDSVIDGRWRLARVDGTKSGGQGAKKSCTITGPKTTQKVKVFSRGILHQTCLVSEKSRLVKQKINLQDAIGLDRFGCFAFQPAPAPTMVLPISPVLREVVARCYKMMDESY